MMVLDHVRDCTAIGAFEAEHFGGRLDRPQSDVNIMTRSVLLNANI